MTLMRIDASQVAALGRTLDDLACVLAGTASAVRGGRSAHLVTTAGTTAYHQLIEDWSLARRDLDEEMRGLAQLAERVGDLYVRVERTATDQVEGLRGR